MEKIRIYCKNTKQNCAVDPGTTLKEVVDILKIDQSNADILAAYVNHELKGLNYKIYRAEEIEFLTYADEDGRRCYHRSLSFVLQKAINDLYPNYLLRLQYNLPNGQYGELRDKKDPNKGVVTIHDEDIEKIKNQMLKIIEKDSVFVTQEITVSEAKNLFSSHGQNQKAKLLEARGQYFTTAYYIDGYGDTFYGPHLYSSGYLKKWDIQKYEKGFCVQRPSRNAPYALAEQKAQERLSEIFSENAQWCDILGARDISSINRGIELGFGAHIISIAEALHSRKYAHIADMIYQRRERVKLVLIAGPSSSGKTTTSKRIALELKLLGLNPKVIAMDDYFVNRELTPRDENGDYDYESVYAMNLELLNSHLTQLFEGKEVTLPKFDFAAGASTLTGPTLKMTDGDILLMEGIHALNPTLTEKIDDSLKFKVYASALTPLAIDENNYISTTDNRELRRMVRDNNFRGASAEDTIMRWPSVVNGENKNIFPYQENADIMFNSSLIYELPMLKYFAEPLLRRISPTSPAYAESLRLLNFLRLVVELKPSELTAIPPTSVMREFIGGSVFTY